MQLLPINADRFLSKTDQNMMDELLSPTQRRPIVRSPTAEQIVATPRQRLAEESSAEGTPSPSRNRHSSNLFVAPRGSNRSLERGKGPKNLSSLVSVQDMLRDQLGILEQGIEDYPLPSNEMLLKEPRLVAATNREKKVSYAE